MPPGAPNARQGGMAMISKPAGPQLPPDVKIVRKRRNDGTETAYYYRRSTGRRIAGEPGTPEFLRSYRAAGKAIASPKPRPDFASLLDKFRASPEFAACS